MSTRTPPSAATARSASLRRTSAITVIGGSINPGDPVTSTGVLSTTNITGVNLSNNGNLTVEISSTGNDTLNLGQMGGGGLLTLGGTSFLTVDLNGLLAAPGTVTIASFGGLTGTFSSVNVINNPGNFVVGTPVYNTNTITLSITGPIVSSLSILPTNGDSTVTAGMPFTIVVSADDGLGNAIGVYTGSVSFSTTTPGDTVSPNPYTYTGSGNGKDNGSHTFTVTPVTAGNDTITVTDAADSLSAQLGRRCHGLEPVRDFLHQYANRLHGHLQRAVRQLACQPVTPVHCDRESARRLLSSLWWAPPSAMSPDH